MAMGVHTVEFLYNDGTAETTLMNIAEGSGGTDPSIPPEPAIPGNTVKEADGGRQIEYDADNKAVGQWKWDDTENAWEFERYSPGESDDIQESEENNNMLLWILLVIVILIIIVSLIVWLMKRHGGATE
jgi:hypothetical protein